MGLTRLVLFHGEKITEIVFPLLCLMYHNALQLFHEIGLYYKELNAVTKPLLGKANVICLAKQILEITAIFVNWSPLWGRPVIPTAISMELNNSLHGSFHHKLETMAKMSRSARLDLHKLGFLTKPQANPVRFWLLAPLPDRTPQRLGELQPPEHSGRGRGMNCQTATGNDFPINSIPEKNQEFFGNSR